MSPGRRSSNKRTRVVLCRGAHINLQQTCARWKEGDVIQKGATTSSDRPIDFPFISCKAVLDGLQSQNDIARPDAT